MEKKGKLPDSLYRATITLLLKLDKPTTTKHYRTIFFLMNIDAIIANKIPPNHGAKEMAQSVKRFPHKHEDLNLDFS